MTVQTGLARLLHEQLPRPAKGLAGLITHPAAVLPDFTHCTGALLEAGIDIVALFSPEHGYTGAVADGATVGDTIDTRTGLPIFSLYGTNKSPTSTMLHNVDVLFFDMQDVGVRFYTFISTLYHILKSVAAAGIPLIVLDRPNPLGGNVMEGPDLVPGFESFIGIAPIPLRYGLTVGELAHYLNETYTLDADLIVIAMQGWRRNMEFDDTGLSWVPTSPAMPHLSTARVYPGTCLLEGTNVSEGRGTALPFEVCGAPWIDGDALARHLNAQTLPGVRFRPTVFAPSASKFNGEVCAGVQLHVIDRAVFRPVTVGLHLLAALKQHYPEHFAWREGSWEGKCPHIDLLAGTDRVRIALDAGADVDALVASWQNDLDKFAEVSRPYQLYG